jgi:hypothetical protein
LPKPKITAQDIEVVLARHFNYRANIIVPNVSWGLGLRYEADLVVLRKSGYADEIEIKVTASDIKADLKKKVQHDSAFFRRLWFAVPAGLEDHPDIPERAGIICISGRATRYKPDGLGVTIIRQAKIRKHCRKMDERKKMKLLSLGCMRIWSLKEKLGKERKARVDG